MKIRFLVQPFFFLVFFDFVVYSALKKAWLFFWTQGNREKCFWILVFDLNPKFKPAVCNMGLSSVSTIFPLLSHFRSSELTFSVHIFLTKPVLRGKINPINTCISLNEKIVKILSSFHFPCCVHKGTELDSTHTEFTGAAFTRGHLQTWNNHRCSL